MPRGVLFTKVLLLASGLLLSLPLLASENDVEINTATPVETVHGLSLYNSPQLPADFAYFPHVNPSAPKGGTITRTAVGAVSTLPTHLLFAARLLPVFHIFMTH